MKMFINVGDVERSFLLWISSFSTSLAEAAGDPHQTHSLGVIPISIPITIKTLIMVTLIMEKASGDGQSTDDADKSRTDEGGDRTTSGRKRGCAPKDHDEYEDGELQGSDPTKLVLKLTADGRYICHICDKTFKTTNILRTHLFTHTDRKDFKCDLCGTAFRTKGSLIRHKRRHTDERPYRCSQCGLSFRESGALTRHLKSLTPCTEKIRYSQCKEILVSKEGIRTEVQQSPVLPQTEQPLPVVSVVESAQDAIHIQVMEDLAQDQQVESHPQAETVVEGDSLICQAIINSGITLETEAMEMAEQAEPGSPKEIPQSPEAESRLAEIQVTEECVEVEEETGDSSEKDEEAFPSRSHKCPQCDRLFRTLSQLRVHIKGHVGYKPFKCPACQKEFLTGYMLKKHMEVHVSERRYKCGECGKLFKAIGHVREHMRAHSNERPHRCGLCDKSYKTKNALQVHLRTHGEDKPYVCPHCARGFREKGALVRHVRHHTGEKPFKCSKCGRGFAEHGTLNRHLRSKGGCFAVQQKESEQTALSSEEQQDSVAATIISEDPHAVLVEFSSVVADTQEYIIGTSAEEAVQGEEEVSIIQDNHSQMDSHIMKVVQQIVSQSRGHQIIVRDVGANESPGVSDSGDTITIATPESLTEQVAMTLASAISDGTILTTSTAEDVTVVAAEDVELMEQEPQYVIAASDEMEIQTVVVV
ncbi:transcription factor E4F1-like isoform X1 [Brachyhypopomus gauderio]|uniref:transcription factor E4F1-like isoform X1 n=1 Tax=Brachyhypopomus gauderio TaxID=698409 RepID=UPI004042030B